MYLKRVKTLKWTVITVKMKILRLLAEVNQQRMTTVLYVMTYAVNVRNVEQVKPFLINFLGKGRASATLIEF